MLPFCSMCGRGCPMVEQQFDRCPVCVDRMLDTITEATPFYGTLTTIICRQAALRPGERRNLHQLATEGRTS